MDEKLLKKIDTYLNKKSHINYFTVKLISYNNNYIYIRFDYVDKIKAYKVVWFDLKYINIKELDQYINMQLVTSFFANKMVEFLSKVQIDSGEVLNHNVLGDRIEIINKGSSIYINIDNYDDNNNDWIYVIIIFMTYLIQVNYLEIANYLRQKINFIKNISQIVNNCLNDDDFDAIFNN